MRSLNHHNLHIETLIAMYDNCPIKYTVSSEWVDFAIGDSDEKFEFSVSDRALDRLIDSAIHAREAMRTTMAAEEAEEAMEAQTAQDENALTTSCRH
ncbi:MAG TPA: hypothetical protein VHX38_25175 [Pseudonocardiaceae bacterium]|jgi:hypothetical protein|nr:hypothetical protein [Pseudonocardiaceae bacterium]